jgi:hypothetical protein
LNRPNEFEFGVAWHSPVCDQQVIIILGKQSKRLLRVVCPMANKTFFTEKDSRGSKYGFVIIGDKNVHWISH